MPMVFSGRAMSSVSRQPSKMAGAVTGSVDSDADIQRAGLPEAQLVEGLRIDQRQPGGDAEQHRAIATPASVSRTGLIRPPASVPIR